MHFTQSTRTAVEKFFAGIALVSIVASLMYGAQFVEAQSNPNQYPSNPNIDICHATKSAQNPYNEQTVDASSIINLPNGHNDHNSGGLDNKGDIIPPFSYDFGEGVKQYPGKNWSTVFTNGLTGEDIYNEGGCDGVPQPILGCTDEHALNYDPEATEDDGSCEYSPEPILGCTDERALNYDPEATVNDGSCEYPQESSITVVTHKIVCTDESDLPNWGMNGGQNITETTAVDWVATHESCSLESGWYFQWVNDSDMFDPGDTLIGEAPAPWMTFGPTDDNGIASVSISEAALKGNSVIWLREVLQSGFMPFSRDLTPDNLDDVSAEFYCNNDVINYDNIEWIGYELSPVTIGETYQCVAWNVPEEEEPQLCTLELVSGTDSDENGVDDNTTVCEKCHAFARLLSYIHPAWTAAIDGASWIWGDDPVEDPTSEETQTFMRKFGWKGPVVSAMLMVASDNSYTAKLNGAEAGSDSSLNNFSVADTFDVTGLIAEDNNILKIAVTNEAVGGSTSNSNPAGLLYKLTIVGTDPECGVPYEEPEDPEEPVKGCMDPEASNYDPEATEDDESCVYPEPETTSSRGGGGRRVSLSDPEGEVLGESTGQGGAVAEPEVLGESIVMPLGAPNTGAGGASPVDQLPSAIALIGIIASIAVIRATRNA